MANDLTWMTNTNPQRATLLSKQDEKKNYQAGVFVVQTWSTERLATKIAAVNRKLAKYGKSPVEPISFEHKVYRKFAVEVDENGTKITVPAGSFPYVRALVYIQAALIQLSDRKHIVGTIDRVGDSDDMVVKPYAKQMDDEAATEAMVTKIGREIRCDHCKSNRRRNGAWVLRNEDGSLFMVAKSCAKDYFGLNVASMLNDLIDLDETSDGFNSPASFERVGHIALVIGVILKHGFVSQTTASGLNAERRAAGLGEVLSTRSLVDEYEDGRWSREHGKNEDTYNVAKAIEAISMVKTHLELAETVIEAIAVQKTTSNFEANCQAAIRSLTYAKDWYANEALIVAGVSSYLKRAGFELPNVWAFKQAEKPAEARIAALPFTPGFVGTPGARIQFVATIETVRPYSGDFPGVLLVLRTNSNHKVLCFGNSAVFDQTTKLNVERINLTLGTRLNVSATVKEHKAETYKGVTSDATIINRPIITMA